MTQETSVLDLADLVRGPIPERSAGARRTIALSAVLGLALALIALVPIKLTQPGRLFAAFAADESNAVAEVTFSEQQTISDMNVDDKTQLLADGTDAEARNAALPFSNLPLDHVKGFVLGADHSGTYSTALKCLTQAVYYEAAVEPLQGRRAVAQVVLNRMRHAAYPKSVCGVVYQGSERRTGCQFSFTCDGSLLRPPSLGPWREAQKVARAALAGYVEQSVGTATRYHADYVLPKWAFELVKINQLGRHIFYRFTGNWGRSAALNGKYSALESIPTINYAKLNERLASDDASKDAVQLTPGLTVPPSITDRHAETDVGGRIDTTKEWRLSIPDPTQASSRYRQTVADHDEPDKSAPIKPNPAVVAISDEIGVARQK